MNKNNITVKGATGTSKLVRPKFGPGMLLQHEDLEQLNSYTRDLSRLMFRSLFGCGVICGLVVTGEEKCGKLLITVGAGLALDCKGDPVHVPKDQQVWVGDDCEELTGDLWVVLCGTSKCCAPRTAQCASDDDEPTSSCTREWDGYQIRVMRDFPKFTCHCVPTVSNGTDEGSKVGEPSDTGRSLADAAGNKDNPCLCADHTLECFEDHYEGRCGCHCSEGCDCDCDCILLARLSHPQQGSKWIQDHSVRRFIRPVLMRDPQIKKDNENGESPMTTRQTQVLVQAQAEALVTPEERPAAKESRRKRRRNTTPERHS
jgi:hypothetical protein